MKNLSLIALLALGLLISGLSTAQANDHMFPPAPAAAPFINFDSRGFMIDGKRTFIVSGSLHYPRVPRALWRDRLLRMKRAGFNTVQTYIFWNYQEPYQGKFDFKGRHNINAFLKLVKSLGMYATVRIGPYVCAEWNSGGYPIWLRFVPGVLVREDNPQFEAAVTPYLDKVLPIIAANQINHGGSVIMVQLENEDPQGWGTEMPNGYFRFLRDKALHYGIQVPYFFSGLHHGSDPAGHSLNLDEPSRPNPWYTTEFWSVWYSQYGAKPGDGATYARRTWKIIAHGGNGYNYYMVHGGTNFSYNNDNEVAASYDYGAAIGQAGDLRPIYYRFKQCAWFARSFQDVLENSLDDSPAYQGYAENPKVVVTARKSQAGTILFLDNPSKQAVQTSVTLPSGRKLPADGPLTLAPREIMPVVHDVPLGAGVALRWTAARIYGIFPQGKTTTLIAYGPTGSPEEMDFSVPPSHVTANTAAFRKTKPGMLRLNSVIPAGAPAEYDFTVGTQRYRILVMDTRHVNDTWYVHAAGVPEIITGPHYLQDADIVNGHTQVTVERPWVGGRPLPTLLYAPQGPVRPLVSMTPAGVQQTSLALSAWQTKNASLEAEPGNSDHQWLSSAEPLAMGADGDITSDAWYRTHLLVPKPGVYNLNFGVMADRMEVFVDGKPASAPDVTATSVPLTLTAGDHFVAVFTAEDGRNKLYAYLGPISTTDAKGISGPVTLTQSSQMVGITDWKVMPLPGNPGAGAVPPSAAAAGWQAYTVGNDAFSNKAGYAWFQAVLPPIVSRQALLDFQSVDDNGTVYLNDKKLISHQGWDQEFTVPVGAAANMDTPNILSILVQNTAGTGGLDKPATLMSYTYNSPVTGWRMRGGPGSPYSVVGWSALRQSTSFDRPRFFRTTFMASPPSAVGQHPIWRVVPTGLGHGSIWVNGHNLGVYPEKIPVMGLYVPGCWLKPGQNSLVIYDQEGNTPAQVSIKAEMAASRTVNTLED